MKRLCDLLALIPVLGLISGCGSGLPEIPEAKLTLQAVDDDGHPVPQTKVAVVGFHAVKEGKTDEAGRFVAILRNASGEVDLEVKKEGFYSINRQTYVFITHTNGQWLPRNPLIELHLHKVGRPVAMVVKQVDQRDIPAVNCVTGYDLVIGDWVEPNGKGKTADFVIEVLKPTAMENNNLMRLDLTFANPNDGLILKSIFYRDDYGLRLPAMAPESGYSNRWEFQACGGNPLENSG